MATKKPKSKAKVKAKAKTAVKTVKASPQKPSPIKASPVAKAVKAEITPLEDRIIIRIAAAEERTAGGLIIPGSAADRPNRGQVVAAGPGRRSKKGKIRPLDVRVGDEILFAEYTGTPIVVEGADFLILREEDVLGIVT